METAVWPGKILGGVIIRSPWRIGVKLGSATCSSRESRRATVSTRRR
jgi:hypothetical protein